MRILYVSHTHPPKGAILSNTGGMQRVSRQLIAEWESCSDIQLQTEAVNVAGRGLIAIKTTLFLLKILFGLPHKAKSFDADVVVFSSMVTAALAVLLKKRMNIPMVTINHGRDVTLPVGIYQKLVPKIFAAVDGVISVSHATLAECIKRGLDPQKGAALGNGFDFDTLGIFPDKRSACDKLAQQFDIPFKDHKMLLTVGRMVKRKGHAWFIEEVWPQVDKDSIYVIIGNGPEFEHVKQLAKGAVRSNNIFILGRQPDHILKQAYAAADLFVMPNIPVKGDMEGFGIVLLEANMAQTPAVASDLEGMKDVISQGLNGCKVPPCSPKKFAQTINDVLAEDLEQMGLKSRTYVKEHFVWNKIASDYAAFLEKIIKNNSNQSRKNH